MSSLPDQTAKLNDKQKNVASIVAVHDATRHLPNGGLETTLRTGRAVATTITLAFALLTGFSCYKAVKNVIDEQPSYPASAAWGLLAYIGSRGSRIGINRRIACSYYQNMMKTEGEAKTLRTMRDFVKASETPANS